VKGSRCCGSLVQRRLSFGAGVTLLALPAAAAHAEAASFTVTSLADDGTGGTTLREALAAAANGNAPTVDRVLFQAGLSGTIVLHGAQLLLIDEPLSIVGPGASTLVVSGADDSRLFRIDTEPGDDVTISGLTLRDGHTVSDLSTSRGGAISNIDADLIIRSSVITDNHTSGDGAGGGGIGSTGGTVTIERSTISGNTTAGTAAPGGGLYLYGTDATIRDSTISGNQPTGAGSDGGGIYIAGALEIENSTIAGNAAGPNGRGGGILAFATGGNSPLTNTVVADNSAPTSGPDMVAFSVSFELAYSLVENTADAAIIEGVPGSNLTGVDPMLEPLAANGGPTPTRALAPNSPALDRGSATGSDQRGAPRPVDFLGAPNATVPGANAADIGAFEFQPPRCRGRPATAVARGSITRGTAGRDVIVGTPARDRIRALGGSDLVCALGGNDTILGNKGSDHLLGEGGRDVLKGGPGRDRLLGGGGRDRLLGGPGRDRLRGGPGRDRQRQ
jgi:Right handed beta helix region/RTX calcium-binding nonapeptide repeat (4 copies)